MKHPGSECRHIYTHTHTENSKRNIYFPISVPSVSHNEQSSKLFLGKYVSCSVHCALLCGKLCAHMRLKSFSQYLRCACTCVSFVDISQSFWKHQKNGRDSKFVCVRVVVCQKLSNWSYILPLIWLTLKARWKKVVILIM